MEETLRNLFVAVLFGGSVSIFGVAMPQTDAALVATAHPTLDVSSMAGLLAQFITNALLGPGYAARAHLVRPGDSGLFRQSHKGRVGRRFSTAYVLHTAEITRCLEKNGRERGPPRPLWPL